MAIRAQGKAGFAQLQQNGVRLQIYVRKDAVGDQAFELYKLLDLGDHIGVSGYLFRTRTGELSIHVETITFLAKAMLALPEKYHGLADVELRYRQRYVDLFMNTALNEGTPAEINVRDVFVKRAKVLAAIRQFFDTRGYIEVETPMMQQIAGGAAASPSPRITTRSISTCFSASRRNSISSASSSADSTACMRSTATSATKASPRNTTPSSPCSSSIRPTPTTTT